MSTVSDFSAAASGAKMDDPESAPPDSVTGAPVHARENESAEGAEITASRCLKYSSVSESTTSNAEKTAVMTSERTRRFNNSSTVANIPYLIFTVVTPLLPKRASVSENAASILPTLSLSALATSGQEAFITTMPSFSEIDTISPPKSPPPSSERTFLKVEDSTAETAAGLESAEDKSTFFTKAISDR